MFFALLSKFLDQGYLAGLRAKAGDFRDAATMLPVSCRGTKRTIYFLLINVRIYILTFPMLMVTADSTRLLLGVKPLLPSTDVEGSQVLVRKHARFHEKAPCGEVIIRQPDGRPVPYREGRKSGHHSSSMSVM